MQNILKTIFSLLVLLSIFLSPTNAKEIKRFNIGYFEAGQYEVHAILREEYFKQLENLLPDNIQIVSIPEGYRSADWNREQSKKMAQQLCEIKHLDFILAVGPWVVQDLLEAGFVLEFSNSLCQLVLGIVLMKMGSAVFKMRVKGIISMKKPT